MLPQDITIGGVRYTLWYSLGAGEYGEVFRATESAGFFRPTESDWQPWAIKRLLTTPDRPDFKTKHDAGIREFVHTLMPHTQPEGPHPNLLRVRMGLDVGEEYYIVMESCEGSLANLFAHGHHGEDWILPIARGLLTGLGFLHDLGALHNDLHCKNVLFVRKKNRPGPFRNPVFFPLHGPGLFTFKIADFGQASSWFRSDEGGEHPELIVEDIRMAAHVLADVALGRYEGSREPAELKRAAGRYAGPIELALKDRFTGEHAAQDFLEALIGAYPL